MGGCHSKKVVIPNFETPGRCRKEDLPVNRQAAAFTLEQLGYLETCLKEAEEKANALLEQLTASEEAKLQLLEKVSLLEKRLQAMSQRSAGGESYENMVLEKDKCIEKLQAEVKASQEKLTAHHPAR
ncbi:Coiled-coil domain-containing protein 192 [Lemmus lemmus]